MTEDYEARRHREGQQKFKEILVEQRCDDAAVQQVLDAMEHAGLRFRVDKSHGHLSEGILVDSFNDPTAKLHRALSIRGPWEVVQ